MTNLSIPYDDWNTRIDSRLFRAATIRAFHTVDSALDLGDVPTGVHPKQDINVGPLQDEIITLLVACVEWLRHREVSATEIQQKFNNVKKVQRELPERRLERDSYLETTLPSDPRGFTPRIDAQGNTVRNF